MLVPLQRLLADRLAALARAGGVIGSLAPFFFYRRRWAARTTRARGLLDKTLGLEERAVTAWELSTREATGAAAQLVLQQAEEKLRAVEPRALFPRRWSWPAYPCCPVCSWFTVLWFDVDRWNDPERCRAADAGAKAREFARELQDKAKNEGLRESLKMGQELEKVARKGNRKQNRR